MKEDVTDFVLGGGALGCFLLAVMIFEGTAFLDVDALWGIPLLIIALILAGSLVQRDRKRVAQRTKKLKNLAEEMGMEFSAKGDSALLATRIQQRGFRGLNQIDENNINRLGGVKITNVLHGDSEQLGYSEDFEVRILDCRLPSGQSGTLQTMICFQSPQLNLPKFQLGPEGWGHKIGSKLGYQDIDFESHLTAVEFSKKYLLRGKDEQKIRALFTDEVLAFFAGQDKICVEGLSSHLCFYRARKLIEPEDIPAFMKEGFEVFRVFARKQN